MFYLLENSIVDDLFYLKKFNRCAILYSKITLLLTFLCRMFTVDKFSDIFMKENLIFNVFFKLVNKSD